MDWLQFFSSLAWPAVAVLALLLFLKPLRQIVLSLRSLSYKEFKADFGQQLQKAETEALQLTPPAMALLPPPPPADPEQRFRALAEISPNSAVLEAWLNVELALKDLAPQAGIDLRRGSSILYLTRVLRQKNIVDQPTAALLEDLRVLRNTAIHPEGEQRVTAEQAERYKEMADRVVARLRSPG